MYAHAKPGAKGAGIFEDAILGLKTLQAALGLVTIAAMHPQNAMLETSPELCSSRPRTGEPNATFGCTEATTPVSQCFHVHSVNASVGPSPDEATTATWRYQSNQQFSITAVTTSSGSVADRYAYTAYGQPVFLDGSDLPITPQSSTPGNRYTYTGREWDQTLGLYHFRARWMSGIAGRFMGRDPISFKGSPWDLYEFADAQPVYRTDPSGEIVPVLIGIGVGIGIFISPNIANAPGPGEPTYSNPGIFGSEPENAVIGGVIGGGVGITTIGIRSGCARLCASAGAAATSQTLADGSYIGWVLNGRIVAMSVPNTSHAALGTQAFWLMVSQYLEYMLSQ